MSSSNKSLSGILSTLIPVALVAGVTTLAFLVLRSRFRRQYEPRSMNLLREQERSPPLSKGMFSWIKDFMSLSDTYVLNHQNLDAYLLLRYLKIGSTICFVGCCITWPVLFPVNITGGGGQTQLDMLSFSNVKTPQNKNRLYAHCFVGWVFFTFIWYMIARETIYYINIRQAYLLSPLYANRMSSRTVLFSAVPTEFLQPENIRRMFGSKLKNYWVSTDTKDLEKLVEERDSVAFKLEAAENKLIKTANDARLKSLKKGHASHEEESVDGPIDANGESGSIASRWVPTKNRPTHKTKFLIGKKVDTINWCRAELERLIPEVEALQATHKAGEAKSVNSIIVEFYNQAEAQAAYQTTTHHQPLHMSPRFIGVSPNEIIWKNLRILWWERVLRRGATITMVCLLVIFWAIPVAFVGILSNIDALIHGTNGKPPAAPWLGFLDKIPSAIFGVVKGLLPSVLLAVLMALLPIFLRAMAKFGGAVSAAQVELSTQNFYYAFQVVQVFLVATLASSATAVGQQIANDPSSAPSLLAQKIPTASNFYISYFILQGLSIPASALLQIVGLIVFNLLGKLLDKTPRKMYKRWISLSGLGMGTVFPVFSLLISISIIYSCIAPLMMGFACIALYLFYLAYRYNIMFVYNSQVDTKGLVYPRALKHITVGMYIALVCMIGLFGVSQSIGPTILTAVYLVGSILFHASFSSAVAPLIATLPKSLEVEEQHLLALEARAGAGASEKPAGQVASVEEDGYSPHPKGASSLPAPHKKPNFLTKWLHPERYTDYQTLRRMVPRDFGDINYDPEVESHAYYNPCIASSPPTLWIPQDSMGISKQEIAHTSKVIPISDHGAFLNDKGKVEWDHEDRPPIFEEKIYY